MINGQPLNQESCIQEMSLKVHIFFKMYSETNGMSL